MSKQESNLYKRAYALFLALIIIAFLTSNRIELTHFEDLSGVISLNGNRIASYCIPLSLCSVEYPLQSE